MLTKDEILYILDRLAESTVVEPSAQFPFRVSQRKPGYSDDPKVGPLQAKLSIMLEAASRRSV